MKLDFLFEKDGIYCGCEIKNTLSYIEKEELDIKMEMCEFFGVRPLFIMRFSPKTYNKSVIDRGGFFMIFEKQIYDLSQKALVEKITKELGLSADCPRAIPEGILERFRRWHEAIYIPLELLSKCCTPMNTIMPSAFRAEKILIAVLGSAFLRRILARQIKGI